MTRHRYVVKLLDNFVWTCSTTCFGFVLQLITVIVQLVVDQICRIHNKVFETQSRPSLTNPDFNSIVK